MDMNKILETWIEITGVNPNDSKIRLRDLDIHRANRIIKKSLEVDPSFITTLMLLDSYLDDFAKDRMISLHDVMSDYDKFSNWLTMINDFRSSIRSEEAMEIKSKFKESLKEAIAHYNVHEDVIEKIVEKDDMLAELRYSSFNAINTLEIAQFSHGEPSGKKPVVYQDVYRFTDINTLLDWMMSVESGIVLALIQDSEDLSNSYFVFAIRNGGTMTILTDRERTAHPLETQMSRSRARGREFENRITSYYFPYDTLMKIDHGDNGRAYVNGNERAVAVREDGVALQPINLLMPDEIVWVILMFGHLNDKFFKENYKTKELSYTPKMMVETDYLLKQADEKGIVIYGYKGIEVPKFTTEELKTEKIKDQFDYESSGRNDWMIERYEVPDTAFDVLPSENHKLMLTDGSGQEMKSLTIAKMNPSYFGDEERLTKDRIYMARYNQAKAINVQIEKEYNERKNEVLEWYEKAIRRNLPSLLEAMAKGRFLVDDKKHASINQGGWLMRQSDGNILFMFDKKQDRYQFGNANVRIYGPSSEGWGKYNCAYNDTKASFIGLFHPTNATMLANLCGCEVSELHELLQNWSRSREDYRDKGNSILQRIDPMDWKVKNPWDELNMDVRIYLSKSGYNALCKKHGIPKDLFWLGEKPYEDTKASYYED